MNATCAAIILAAGESRRMGSPKALLDAGGGETFLARLARVFGEAGCEVWVVVGHDAERIRGTVQARFAENARWREGQLSSVRAGLSAAVGARRFLIHPVDVPWVSADTIRRVARSAGEAVVPAYQGKPGHPLALSAAAARTILDRKELPHLEAAVTSAERLDVDDPGIIQTANTPEEYAELRRIRG